MPFSLDDKLGFSWQLLLVAPACCPRRRRLISLARCPTHACSTRSWTRKARALQGQEMRQERGDLRVHDFLHDVIARRGAQRSGGVGHDLKSSTVPSRAVRNVTAASPNSVILHEGVIADFEF